MKTLEQLAREIVAKLETDIEFANWVWSSNEPFAAMILDCKLANHVVDGSPEWHALVDVLELLLCNA